MDRGPFNLDTQMKREILKFFTAQRQIFGVCPHSGQFFRLSDCKVYLKGRPTKDWMDELAHESERLDGVEERIETQEEVMRERARAKGREQAALVTRKIDPVFTPRKLNPDDAKVIFHPIDYIVFNGMKDGDAIKAVVLLDRENKGSQHRQVQHSIEKTIEKANYEWVTLRVFDDGGISEE